jgi:hypothetical protein
MTTKGRDSVSPSLSADTENFQDAADVDQRDLEATPHENGRENHSANGDERQQEAAVKGKKGKGVAALMARFEKSTIGKPEEEQSVASTVEVTQDGKDVNDQPGDDTVVQRDVDDDVMDPSEGAPSMIDPSETIINPFSAKGKGSDSIEGQPPETPQVDLKRFSDASQRVSLQSDIHVPGYPDTPSTTAANRFSTVSLSTSHGEASSSASRRRTVFVAAPTRIQEEHETEASGSSEFVSRNTARLSMHEEGKRGSLSNDHWKEKLDELRVGRTSEDVAEEDRRTSTATLNIRRSGNGLESVQDARYSVTSSWTASDGQEHQENDHIDWNFWGDVMSNYQEIARTQPKKLSQAIQAGIPDALRGMMWQLMSSSKDEELEIIYAYYLKQTSPHEKMIRKDLSRTFPGQDYFQDGKGIGQENLFNVVKAYSLYDEECGYCQGMQFVVGPLLLNMPDEEAFSTLVRMMKSYDLRGHFIPNMPALQLRLFQFERLLEDTLPLLHRHLVRQGVKSSMYASGWIMTLFTYRSPLSICFRILDSVFAEGIEAIFRFALALMHKNEEQLLSMNFDEAVPLLAGRIFDVYKCEDERHEEDMPTPNPDRHTMRSNHSSDRGTDRHRVSEFIADAFAFKITPFMLDSYANDFAEQVRLATAHRREVEELKIDNRALQIRVKSLEEQLGSLQQEHVDLVKNVVMAKLAKEEMAEELMRYKMMYAEAALLVDQNNVTQSAPPAHSPPPPAEQSTMRQSQ